MSTKSDFAQKLLHDLRVRKERMVAAQNSSRQSTQTSRVEHGNSGQTSRGSRQINALESAGPRAGNTSRDGNNKQINTKESSNQMVLYGNRQSSRRQTRNLSMAIAFAFGNNGNLSKITTSTTNPLVSFFNRFGRKSRDTHKMDITSFDNRDEPTGQFPRVSSVHITEVSKGVQKLNQILRACSNGFSFESNSVEVGKELLKGAVDLEESLRRLVRLQEASQYSNTTRKKKSRLKLLEEDEYDQEDDAKIVEQWKLDRPKFSFDKPSRYSRVVQNAIKQEDLCISTQVKQNNNNSSSSESMQGKRRISNVVAKLMGLEEIHQNEDSILKRNDSKGKQVKVLKQINQVNVHHQSFEDNQRKQNPMSGKQRKSTEHERKMKFSNNEQQQKAENHKTTNSINSIETRKEDKEPPSNQQKHEENRVLLLLLQEHVLKRGESTKHKHRMDKSHAGRQIV